MAVELQFLYSLKRFEPFQEKRSFFFFLEWLFCLYFFADIQNWTNVRRRIINSVGSNFFIVLNWESSISQFHSRLLRVSGLCAQRVINKGTFFAQSLRRFSPTIIHGSNELFCHISSMSWRFQPWTSFRTPALVLQRQIDPRRCVLVQKHFHVRLLTRQAIFIIVNLLRPADVKCFFYCFLIRHHINPI